MRNRHNLFAIIIISVITCFISCSDEDFKMNDSFIKSETFAEFTDQTEIELATYHTDSVLTSGFNRAWVGKCQKPIIGTIYSESYIRMSEPTTYDWKLKEKYDSVNIVLVHTGEYQGDTTKAITINVNRLATPLQPTDNEKKLTNSFYNCRTFRDSTEIGTFRFVPRPHTRPRVRFRLHDTFGKELTDFIISNQYVASDQLAKRYEKLLGGIKISCDTTDAQSLLAFYADSIYISIHSHVTLMRQVKIERRILLTHPEHQYNHVWNENVEKGYDKLTQRYYSVSEKDGGLHSVMFEGLGYYTRINFPGFQNIVEKNYSSHVVKAILKIYVERDSYDKRKIPPMFFLYQINKGNVRGEPVYMQGSSINAMATLINNTFDRDQVYYYVDITNYVNFILSQKQYDPNDGLVITWGLGESPTNYDFVLFGGHNKSKNKSVLEIYYYDYDKEHR